MKRALSKAAIWIGSFFLELANWLDPIDMTGDLFPYDFPEKRK